MTLSARVVDTPKAFPTSRRVAGTPVASSGRFLEGLLDACPAFGRRGTVRMRPRLPDRLRTISLHAFALFVCVGVAVVVWLFGLAARKRRSGNA